MKITILLTISFLCLNWAQMQAQCTVGDCSNGKGRFVYPNGDRYVGEFKSSKPDGRGTYYFANGDIYKGQFKAGARHGYGTFTWKDGDSYIGEYSKNEREGEGTYYYTSGNKEYGIWKAGKLIEHRTLEPLVDEPDTVVKVVVDPHINDPFNTHGKKDSTKTIPNPNALVVNKESRFQKLEPIPKTTVSGETRYALIIGNSQYPSAELKNPRNDAMSMAQELQKSGFTVFLYLDANQRDMKQAIRDFGQQLKDHKAIGLFFYAGHGLQANGHNYLVPVDADIRKAQDIEFESFDLSRVLVEMEYAENPMNIIILDACRDNPFKDKMGDKASANNGFSTIQSAPPNSVISFSTAPGTVASDGAGDHGLYSQELLKAMQEKGVKLEDIFKKVRSQVRKASGGKQIPWENSSIESDFYFKK